MQEELQLLRENNQMLKQIIGYIQYKEHNKDNSLMESFFVNLLADRLGNGLR